MHKRFFYILLIPFIINISSCSEDISKPAIEKEKFFEMLIDFHKVNAIINIEKMKKEIKKDDTISVYNFILKKHNVNRTEFDKTITYYINQPTEYVALYNEIVDTLDAEQQKLIDNKRGGTKKRQKNDLWNLKDEWHFPKDGERKTIPFSVKTDKQGKYKLIANIRVFKDDKSIGQRMTIVANYDDNTSDENSNGSIVKDGKYNFYSVEIKTDSKKKLTKISGWVLNHSEGTKNKHVDIKDIKLLYFKIKE